MPEISLILSCYNQGDLAELVFSGIAAQDTSIPFEVLICDDGSSDSILDAARRFCAGTTDVRYIWQPDKGFRLSRSRNNGIRCAQGSILAFADGDTWLSPTFIQDHWAAHNGGPRLVCGLRWNLFSPAGSDKTRIVQCFSAAMNSMTQEQAEHQWQRRWLGTQYPWMACIGGNFSVPKVAGEFFDESFEGWGSEDRDFSFRMIQHGLETVILPRPNAIQIRTDRDRWANMNHEDLAAFLRGKVLLWRKYPNGEMLHSLTRVCFCRLDESTNTWSMERLRVSDSIDSVLEQFEHWDRATNRAALRQREASGGPK